MSVPVFKDLDKSALDIISRGFPTTSHGFEVEGGSLDGVTFKVTGTHAGESLNSSLETTKLCVEKGVSIKATASSAKGVPVYSAEVAYTPSQVPGLKATFNSECKTPESGQVDTNKLTLLYKRENLTVEESAAYSANTLSFVTSAAVAHQALRAGAQALYSFGSVGAEGEKKFSLNGYGVKLGYVPTPFLSAVVSYDKTTTAASAGATVYYRKDITETATQVTIDPQNPSKAPVFTVAVSHAYDARTTLKAKATSANKTCSASIKHQLTPALAVTFASECNAFASADAKAPTHKHGVAVNLKL